MDSSDQLIQNSRESASPARTIDSVDSAASMQTIVDRNNRTEIIQSVMENSMNTTNDCSKNSLTNSQISMLSSSNGPKQQHQNQQSPLTIDNQSHIYSSPDYGVTTNKSSLLNNDNIDKPKMMTLIEFQKQQLNIEPTNNTLESKISKKQRIPPQLISMKPTIEKQNIAIKKPKNHRKLPIQIILGTIQLILSISLVALGGLTIVRNASLANTGVGIWTGGIAAITGALGVINIKKVQTGFLALSLVCVASSTLGLALAGIGLIRDINKIQQKFDLMNTNGEVSVGCGLIFALFLHFIVSIVSVYQCALRIYIKNKDDPSHILENIITANNSAIAGLSQENVEEYIKTMSLPGREKMLSAENTEKLMAMWMYNKSKKSGVPSSVRSVPAQATHRPIMLIPATGANRMPPVMRAPPSAMLMSAPPHGMQYRGMTLPHLPPGSIIYPDGTYRLPPSVISKGSRSRPVSDINRRRSKIRAGKNEAARRQRRKSDTDAENRKAFTYTGLDRAIADSFLARQEQTNSSNLDYASSTESYRNGCRDVVM